jgi:hypothetical protein
MMGGARRLRRIETIVLETVLAAWQADVDGEAKGAAPP